MNSLKKNGFRFLLLSAHNVEFHSIEAKFFQPSLSAYSRGAKLKKSAYLNGKNLQY